jgi:hypothetical protein
MSLVVQRSLMNVNFSLFKFLNENTYTVGVTAGTLKQHFSDLMIMSAYPDDLMKTTKPTLAVGGLEVADAEADFFGGALFGATYRLPLYGFVMGRGSDAKNKAYRDRLMSDLYEIFIAQCGDEGFDLYDADSKTLQDAGGLEITNARARMLPVNAPDIEADRYKFVFELDVHYA